MAGLLALALVAPAGAGFWERHPRSQVSLRAWYSVVSKAAWDTPSDVRMVFQLGGFCYGQSGRVQRGGNEFRIVAHVSYRYRRVLIKFVGTMEDAPPVEVLRFCMEQSGRTQADLAALFGSRSRASEVLSGKRRLNLPMIARLSRAWGIPADALIGKDLVAT